MSFSYFSYTGNAALVRLFTDDAAAAHCDHCAAVHHEGTKGTKVHEGKQKECVVFVSFVPLRVFVVNWPVIHFK